MATFPTVGATLGRYRIVEQIGQGGMGVVFRAFDEQLQRHVALKFTAPHGDESRRKRFKTEALALARLNHPHIGVIYGFENLDGNDVLVMEYVAGETLGAHIGGKPLPEPEVIALGIQLAAALREAHQCGVIHRDLKPGNIMLTPDGYAKVLDFGLALLQTEGNNDTVSRVKLEGTMQYIAPEVLRGGVPDERSDLYSLGAVLYEMATGRSPHARENFAGTLESILYQTPVAPEQIVPGISASLAAVIKKSLENDPSLRYQSAAELRADLVAMQSGTALDLPRARSPFRRWRAVTIAVSVVIVACLVWAGMHWRGAATRIPQKKVIAVLPFDAIGGGAEDQALSRGLTDLVTVRLAQAGPKYGFEVVPASEVRQQEIASAQQARQKLGASLVVEGSWEFSGEHRIMYALVDTARERNVNATVVRADMGNMHAAENDVLQQLLGMLDVEMGGAPGNEPQPARPDAYQYYVRGRGYLWDYQNQQSLDRAIALFKIAADADPKFALAYAGLGEAYWRRYEETKDAQWVQQAMASCEHAASLNKNLSQLDSTLGLIYHGTGKQEDAVTHFLKALRLDPTNDTASRGLAASYESLGQFDKAEAAYRQAIALRPDYWGGYHDLGVYFYKRGNLDAAAGQFARELQLVPDNVRAYTDLGGIYYLQEKYDQARTLFQQSLKIQPNYRAYSNLGTMYFFDRRYADSAAMFGQALKTNDRDPRVWRNLAASYYWAGRKDDAANAFGRAAKLLREQLTVNPKDASIALALADCESMLGNRNAAEELLHRALGDGNQDADSAFRAAQVYEQLGDRRQSLLWLKKAVRGGYSLREIERDPTLAELRKDPAYLKIQKH